MSGTSFDTVILEHNRYDEVTRKWNIPILNIRGVSLEDVYIDGNVLEKGNYFPEGNYISLFDKVIVQDNMEARVVIKYNPSNMLVTFWVPIIVAVIGLLGSIGQPILHSVGILYTNELKFEGHKWGYDTEKHQFDLELLGKNIDESDKKKYVIYVGVRKEDYTVDPKEAEYSYIAGPFNLGTILNVVVETDHAFTENVAKERAYVQAAVFLVGKGFPTITPPLKPAEFDSGKIKLISLRCIKIKDLPPSK